MKVENDSNELQTENDSGEHGKLQWRENDSGEHQIENDSCELQAEIDIVGLETENDRHGYMENNNGGLQMFLGFRWKTTRGELHADGLQADVCIRWRMASDGERHLCALDEERQWWALDGERQLNDNGRWLTAGTGSSHILHSARLLMRGIWG